MPLALKIVVFILLLPIGGIIIYKLVDGIYSSVVEYQSATGRDVCVIFGGVLVLIYWVVLAWLFFIH